MKRYNITVNGKAYDVAVEEIGAGTAPAPVASAPVATAPAPAPAPTASGTPVEAPMPGTILDIKVKVGDTIAKDAPIMVLEAMKMENDINSPVAGKVVAINVAKGTAVETGTVIAVIQ